MQMFLTLSKSFSIAMTLYTVYVCLNNNKYAEKVLFKEKK